MRRELRGVLEVFLAFLKLGCIAFGGPVAHLGYYQEELVRKRRWLDDGDYADIVALCQFLPGPASSQVGFAIGLKRAGIAGAFAAWTGFTLPSAILMIGFALGLGYFGEIGESGWVVGLKLAAVAVVANAIWSMAGSLCPDRARASIAIAGAAFLLLAPGPEWQVAVIALGALTGWLIYRRRTAAPASGNATAARVKPGWPWLALFIVLLLGLPLAEEVWPTSEVSVIDGFYRAGSLVFGGGHVVLPLLESFTVGEGWVDRDTFLAGYGAAQAVPGPLFSFCGFLGVTINTGPTGVAGGVLALIAVYVPSWLLVLGAMPYWDRLRKFNAAQAALMGTNAAVVGLLLAAFYNPIWTAAITSPERLAIGLLAFAALRFGGAPPWALVVACAVVGQMGL